MSLLLRAAVLGAIAYVITRSLSNRSATYGRMSRPTTGSAGTVNELHPGESAVWPTSENQPAAANAGPSA